MMSSRAWKVWSVLPLVGALAFVVGCAEVDTVDTVDTTDGLNPARESVQPLRSAKSDKSGPMGHGARPPGPPGPAFLLGAALHELELSDVQKTVIEGAMANLAPEPGARGPRDGAVFAALAEGVRAGRIDEASVLSKVEVPDPAAQGARVASALETLHTTLTKEQRRALVDAVATHAEEHGPPRGPGEKKGDCGADGKHGGAFGPLGHLLSELDLSETQREAIAGALEAERPAPPDFEAMKKRFEAFHAEMSARLESFVGESFDAKAFVAPPEGAPLHGPREHLAQMVKELSVVVPLLETVQREKLAALLEKGPPAPMAPPR